MPVVRVTPVFAETVDAPARLAKPYTRPASKPARAQSTEGHANPDSLLSYPTSVSARARFVLPGGKRLSPHQWKVYDTLLKIPPGSITTYGELARASGSSPRAIGGALRSNPFAPEIPCHRVIASTLFIGGFQGEWGSGDDNGNEQSAKLRKKLDLLRSEGVEFDSRGKLKGGEDKLWRF